MWSITDHVHARIDAEVLEVCALERLEIANRVHHPKPKLPRPRFGVRWDREGAAIDTVTRIAADEDEGDKPDQLAAGGA